MIIEEALFVKAERKKRIEDAWRDAMWLCIRQGYDFVVKQGSYRGQIRRQLPFITIRIVEPWITPLAPILPPSCPFSVATDEDIANYCDEYLLNDKVAEDKQYTQYTYGTHIKPQLPKVIKKLIGSKGNTNQACIAVGDINSIDLDDPQCLRMVDFKVVKSRLNMSVVFRSWDLFSGLPKNLGGLQLLKEYVLSFLQEEFDVEDGELIAFSDGLHIYEQYFEVANALNVDKIQVAEDDWEDKEEFRKILDKEVE